MPRFLIFLLIVAVLGTGAASAEEKKFDPKQYPSRMSLSTYETNDFNTVNRILYDSEKDLYYPQNRQGRHILSNASCMAEYLREQQAFPLATMMKRLGYTPQMAEEQAQIGISLNHEQVVFLEMNRLVPRGQWDGDYGPAVLDDIGVGHDAPDVLRRKTASLWTISGQTLSHDPPYIVPAKLPWQSEPGMDELARKYLDRSKYKFVSEWGRASQIHPGEINPLYSAAAATDYQRVRAMGGKLQDAWVMVDSDRAENIRLYDKLFPGRRFPPGADPAENKRANVIYLIPLEEMMNKFPPRKYMQRVAKIVELSDGKLSDADALDLLNHYDITAWDELNFHSRLHGDQGQPLLIHDFSTAGIYGKIAVLRRFGIADEKITPLMDYLTQFRHQFGTTDEGQYPDASDMNFYHPLRDLNAIELANLNGKLAKSDPDFVKAALLSTYSFYFRKFHGGRFPSQGEAEALHRHFLQSATHFAITTSDPEIIRQARALQPMRELQAPILEHDDFGPPRYRQGYSFIFSIPRINALANASPGAFLDYCQQAIQAGSRRTHYLLNSKGNF